MPAGLRPWVSDIAVGSAADPAEVMVHPPDGATTLVYRRAPGVTGAVVLGPRTRATYSAGKAWVSWLRIRIRPGRAHLMLGVPARELADRCVPLAELWDAAAAAFTDAPVPEDERILRRLAAAGAARLSALSHADLARADLVSGAAASLTGSRPAGVHATAGRLHLSERHLRALFTDAVGLAPKRYARITRVRGVLARARDGRWARLASEAGYTDQAHLTADFRDLMGVPPAAFLAGHVPAPTPCSA